ncbi:MAG TPA: hypothetical protein VF838_18225 [Trebonia sp.]
MPAPADAPEVVCALRLGWYIAEVRGRYRPAGRQPPGNDLPRCGGYSLPLRIERTVAEQRAEAQAVLRKLCGDLQIDTVTVDSQQQSRTVVIEQQARALAAAEPGSAAAAAAWNDLSASIYELDSCAQDTLAAQSDMRAAAYQLGRGLAEAYWALDPDAACAPLMPWCWTFLLGEHRCEELARLVGRLSGYFNPYCAPAVAGTLHLWQSVASDQKWRTGAQDHLYRQLRRWYELLVLGQDPSTLIPPYALLKDWRAAIHAVRALWAQLVTAAVSIGLVIALITLILSGSANASLKAVFGVVGVVGLSAASIAAGLKTTAQGLLSRLRQDAYTDLVAAAIAEAPGKPGARNARKAIVAEVRKRTLTTVGDASVP